MSTIFEIVFPTQTDDKEPMAQYTARENRLEYLWERQLRYCDSGCKLDYKQNTVQWTYVVKLQESL